ncbi:cystathionine gamma-synthase [Actinoplanes ianthinogenes]|uniref:Cystathionine gamma-synthase n=1 Tax=Actinoplanes ianthinogenes TaxID=122358 RepID=A0ABM7LNJ7_9ACTN|nr:PLP-dependent aspartate aminotransferase family protein [Actinoplanes ianthinogenes]BCJ40857.1 cystathionine gamma-synthase [Actinoplanes ianthinogenes]GGR24731.1 cystathionine gamma-synthase [Actinoplanes ianthinogenes]
MSTATAAPVSAATAVAQALGRRARDTGAYPPAVSVGVTYVRDRDYALPTPMAYQRDQGSPAFEQVEELLTHLEHGTEALLMSSGMAAITAVFQALPSGSRVVVPEVKYFGLTKWLRTFGADQGLTVVEVPMDDLDAVRAALRAAPTALVWVETPANPTWKVTDVAAVAQLARQAGALLAVDNTVATPVHTNPLLLGASIVMHSATKYLNGHDDVMAGGLVTDGSVPELWERLKEQRRLAGQIPGTLEAYLLQRGMRTLTVRMPAVSRSAMEIATYFSEHPLVERVAYPGLASDPGHRVAAKQMSGGFSGMMSVFLRAKGGAALETAKATELFLPATSLGGTASLIEHRFTFEGPGSRSPENMVRLSVGLEDTGELIADLEQAIAYGSKAV